MADKPASTSARGPSALNLGNGPKVDFDKLRSYQTGKPVPRNIPGGPEFTKTGLWLAWAETRYPGLKAWAEKLPDYKAGHAGWDRNKDIELVQAHSDVTIQKSPEAEKRGGDE